YSPVILARAPQLAAKDLQKFGHINTSDLEAQVAYLIFKAESVLSPIKKPTVETVVGVFSV
ncbi:6079_t:CDS:1, partial [Racocetra persica]